MLLYCRLENYPSSLLSTRSASVECFRDIPTSVSAANQKTSRQFILTECCRPCTNFSSMSLLHFLEWVVEKVLKFRSAAAELGGICSFLVIPLNGELQQRPPDHIAGLHSDTIFSLLLFFPTVHICILLVNCAPFNLLSVKYKVF